MKRLLVVPVAMMGLALAGCATSADQQNVNDCQKEGSNASGCMVTIQYHGRPLECVSWGGDHGEVGLTCDFVGYYGNTFNQPAPTEPSSSVTP